MKKTALRMLSLVFYGLIFHLYSGTFRAGGTTLFLRIAVLARAGRFKEISRGESPHGPGQDLRFTERDFLQFCTIGIGCVIVDSRDATT
jgi:hypothetical protein